MWSKQKIAAVFIAGAVIALGQWSFAGAPFPETDFEVPQGAYSATFVEDRDHVAIMEFAGNYDRNLPDGGLNAAARAVVGQEFFANHADTYDFLVVFTSFEFSTGEATAFHVGVRNDTQGIGKPIFDHSGQFGSDGKLQSYIDMAAISRYELNPLKPEFEQVLNILGHETLHRWASSIRYLDDQGDVRSDLLGKDGAHWNFFLDTDASVEYGHQWRDNGDGSFSAEAARRFYSPLDLYLMGFYTEQQVPDMLLLNSPTTEFAATDLPSPGARIDATTESVSISQVIAHEGPRVPLSADAQKEFRFAFIYLTSPDSPVDDATLRQLNHARKAFAERFTILTGGQGIAHIYPEAVPAADLGIVDPLENSDPISTDPVSVNDALAWLRNAQDSEGFWQDKSATQIRDTATVLAVLNDLDSSFNQNNLAVQWLLSQSAQNNDSLSQQIFATNNSDLIQTLVAAQNEDGGWGLTAELASNPLDTALAVEAILNSSGSLAARTNGVQYLQSLHAASGFWPTVAGGPANLLATVGAMKTLRRADPTYSLQSSIDWLATQQNIDGSFGEGGGTVHETAQSLMLFIAFEALDRIDVDSAIHYVNDNQRSGGHWGNSVYTTALAAQALQSIALPNLILQSVSAINQNPIDGERIRLRALVSNDSVITPPTSEVQFYLGDPQTGGVPVGASQSIIGVPPNTSVVVDFYFDTLDLEGDQEIFVVVDPTNVVSERNERDNIASLNLSIGAAPVGVELEINENDLFASPTAILALPTEVGLSATVRNFGQTDATDTVVEFYQGGSIVGTETVSIFARSSAVVNFVTTISEPGTNELRLIADPGNVIPEDNELNNAAALTVNTLDGLDIGIGATDITLAGTVNLHQDVTIPITLHNYGTVTSPNVEVKVSIVDDGGAVELQTLSVIIEPGQFIQRELLWRPENSGSVNILVEIDTQNLVAELDETNNVVSHPVNVQPAQGVNLHLSHRDVTFTPSPALEGMGVNLEGVLYNNGTETVTSVQLAFYEGDPSSGGAQIGSLLTVPSIDPGESLVVSTVWPEVLGTANRTIYFLVDPANVIAELDETDNSVFELLSVESLPDLTLSAGNIVASPAFPKQDEAVDILVTVNNLGRQGASEVLVRLFNGQDEIGSGQTIALVPGDGASTVVFSTSFVSSGDQPLRVDVDPDNTVRESNELNNSSDRLFAVQDGSFYVTERYISPDGNGIKDQSDYFFRLSEPDFVQVQILDKYDRVVRSFERSEQEVATGSASWDGRNYLGVIAPDGDYRFVVVNGINQILGATYVTVDTNRSSLAEAIDTPFSLYRNITSVIGQEYHFSNIDPYGFWSSYPPNEQIYSEAPEIIQSSDDEFLFFSTFLEPYQIDGVWYYTNEEVRYPSGVYRSLNDGSQVIPIIEQGQDVQGITFDVHLLRAIVPTQDSSKVVLLLAEDEEDGKTASIVSIDLETGNQQLIWQNNWPGYPYPVQITGLQFIQDDSALVFAIASEGETQIIKAPINGLDPVETIATIEINRWDYDDLVEIYNPKLYLNKQQTHLLVHHPLRREGAVDEWRYDQGNGKKEFSIATLVDIETGNTQRIGEEVGSVSWSPSGQVFAIGNANSPGIEIVDTNGQVRQTITYPKQLADDPQVVAQIESFVAFSMENRIWGRIPSMSWSPDGTELAFALEDYVASVGKGLFKINASKGYGGYGGSIPPEILAELIQGKFNDVGGIYIAKLETSTLNQVAVFSPTPFVQESCCGSGEELEASSFAIEVASNVEALDTNNFGLEVDSNSGLPKIAWASFYWNEYLAGRTKTINWLAGSRSVLVSGSFASFDSSDYYEPGENGTPPSEYQDRPILVDIENPTEESRRIFTQHLLEYGSHVLSSPLEKYLSFSALRVVGEGEFPEINQHLFQSLLNLSLDLKAIRSPKAGGIILKGTASDKHFESFQLEYSLFDDPENWQLLMPRSTDLIIDDQFTVWSAPVLGNYYIRLTASDLAGNLRSEIKRVSVTENASITNLYRQPAHMSPNGDGVQESVAVNFRVLSPVNSLQLEVVNSSGTVVRTYEQQFDTIGQDEQMVWDGRNENGVVQPDGLYTLKLQKFEFTVNLDNTPPDIDDLTKQLLVDHSALRGSCAYDPDRECRISIDRVQQFAALDLGSLPTVYLESRELDSSNWNAVDIQVQAQTTTDGLELSRAILDFPFQNLARNDYRIRAIDDAGNTSIHYIPTNLKQNQVWIEGVGNDVLPGPNEDFRQYPDLARKLPFQVPDTIDWRFDNPLAAELGVVRVNLVETIQDPIQSVEILHRPENSGSVLTANLEIDDSFTSTTVTNYLFSRRCPFIAIQTKCVDITGNGNFGDRRDNEFSLLWSAIDAGLETDKSHEILVRITTISGDVHISNPFVLAGDIIKHGIEEHTVPITEENKIGPAYRPGMTQYLQYWASSNPDVIAEIRLMIQSSDDQRFLNFTQIDTIVPNGTNSFLGPDPSGAEIVNYYWFDASDLLPCIKYGVEATLVLKSGSELKINTTVESPCFYTEVAVFPLLPEDCDDPATNTVRIELTPTFDGTDEQKEDTDLSRLYISARSDITGEYDDVLFNWNDPDFVESNNDTPYAYEVDITDYQDLDYLSLRIELFDIENNSSEKNISIPIVTTPPQIAISFPLENQKVCASNYSVIETLVGLPESDQEARFLGIPVQGNVISQGQVFYKTRMVDYCSVGEATLSGRVCRDDDVYSDEEDVYTSSMIRSVEVIGSGDILSIQNPRLQPVTGFYEANGELAFPKMSGVGQREIVIEAYNWSGAKVCMVRQFEVDAAVDGYEVLMNTAPLFSPNGDGVLDEAEFTVAIEETATLTVHVHEWILGNGGGTKYIDGNLVATPVNELGIQSGDSDFSWNGQTDSGTALADGLYHLYFIATDGCGIQETYDFVVEIDSTYPLANIVYPQSDDPIAMIVEILGNVNDINLQNYDIGLVQDDQFVPITNQSHNVSEDILGTWNSFGLSGDITLRLVANDGAGNTSVFETSYEIPEREALISDHIMTEAYFSPNQDGRLETAVARTKFERDVVATIEVIGAGQVVKVLANDTSFSAGYVSHTWDGTNQSGVIVDDGVYSFRVYAEDAVVNGFNQTESVSIVKDTVGPEIVLDDLVNGYLEMANLSGLVINGRIEELHFGRYAIEMTSGPNGLGGFLILESEENVNDVVLAELAEENFETEGFYGLAVTARDLAENNSRVDATLLVDRTPPKVQLNTPENFAAFNSSLGQITVEGEIEERHLKRYELSIVPQAEPEQSTVVLESAEIPGNSDLGQLDLTSLAEGNYFVTVLAEDLSGLSGHSTIEIIIDNTPPNVEISQPGDSSYITEVVPITGAANDENFKQYSLALASGFVGIDGAYEDLIINTEERLSQNLLDWAELPEDGQYTLRLRAVDNADNQAEIYRQFTVDTQPPTAPKILDATFEREGPDVVVTWSANSESDLSGYIVYRNGQPLFIDPISTLEYVDANVVEGKYQYAVRAIDQAGLESDLSEVIEVRVDLTPPTTSITIPFANSKVSGLVNIRGTAHSEEDFSSYRVYVGQTGTDLNLIKESAIALIGDELAQWETLSSQDGAEFTIRLETEDLSGNVGVREINVIVDNLSPNAPTNLSADETDSDVFLVWEHDLLASDLVGYLLFRNGKLANVEGTVIGDLLPYAIDALSYDDLNRPDGIFAYVVYAVDEAGNVSEPSNEVQIEIDNRAPHATIISVEPGQNFEDSLYLLTEQEDLDIAQVTFQYRLVGDTAWTPIESIIGEAPYEYLWDTSSIAYGDYELTAVAIDTNNNTDIAPELLLVQKVDLTAPVGVQGLNVGIVGFEVSLSWEANPDVDLQGYYVYRKQSDTSSWSLFSTDIVTSNAYVGLESTDGVYDYSVVAVDQVGNLSDRSEIETNIVFVPELEQQVSPTIDVTTQMIGVTVPGAEVTISVDNSGGNTDIGLITADESGQFELQNISLAEGVNTFVVVASHPDFNSVSRGVSIEIINTSLPSKPVGLTAIYDDTNDEIDLNWDANPDEENIAGYRIHRDDISISPTVYPINDSVDVFQTTDRASYIVDGSTSTYWYASLSTDNTYFGLEFSQPELVERVIIQYRYTYYSPNRFDIQGWNGSRWVTLKSISEPLDPDRDIYQEIVLDTPYLTERIRVVPYEAYYSTVYVSELEVLAIDLEENISVSDVPNDGYHDYQVSAVNGYGFEGPKSDPANVAFGDVEAPDTVVLTATVVGSSVDLSWTASASPDISRYTIYRNGEPIFVENNINNLTHLDGPLANGTYEYSIIPADVVGNEGASSNIAVATVAIASLPAPTNLQSSLVGAYGHVMLTWEPGLNSSPEVFELYRSTASGSGFVLLGTLNQLTFIDETVVLGETYYYHVIALDDLENPSAPSNETSIYVEDTVGPVNTVLTGPASALLPYVTDSDEPISIVGYAEPNSRVYLVDNGEVKPTPVIASDVSQLAASFPFALDQATSSVHGLIAARVWDNSESVEKLIIIDDQNHQVIHEDSNTPLAVRGVIWIDQKLLVAYSSSAGAVWDLVDPEFGDVESLLNIPVSYLGDFQFIDFDSKNDQMYFYINQYGSAENLRGTYQFDFSTGQLRSLTAGYSTDRPQGITIDKKELVYSSYTGSNGLMVRLYNFELGEERNVLFSNVYNFHERYISQYGPYIAVPQRIGDIWQTTIYNYLTDERHIVGISAGRRFIDSPTWTPKHSYMYSERNFDTDEYEVVEYDLNTYEKTVYLNANSEGLTQIYNYHATSDGQWIANTRGIENNNEIRVYTAEGLFEFTDISLDEGDNQFSAFAIDESDNIGNDADTVNIILRSAPLPDLDLTIVPGVNVGVIGRSITFSLNVRNLGNDVAPVPDLSLSAIDASGQIYPIAESETGIAIGPGLSFDREYIWRPISAGNYTIVGHVDPENSIEESSEFNNVAILEIPVSTSTIPVVELTLDAGPGGVYIYSPNSMLSGNVSFANTVEFFSGQLEITITDENGYEVDVLHTEEFENLPYGYTIEFPYDWNASGIYPGNYRVLATLEGQAGGTLVEESHDFSIASVLALTSSLFLDRSAYDPNVDVLLTGVLLNSGGNLIYSGGSAELVITKASGAVVYSTSAQLGELLPGEETNIPVVWNTGVSLAETYFVALTVRNQNGSVVSSSNAEFSVLMGQPDFSGSLNLVEEQISGGSDIAASYVIANRSNSSVSNVDVRLELIDPDTDSTVRSNAETASFAVNDLLTFVSNFNTQGLPLKRYDVRLSTSVLFNGVLYEKEIVIRSVTLFDATPPDTLVATPADSQVLNWERNQLEIYSTDVDSGVGRVEARYDTGTWFDVPVDTIDSQKYVIDFIALEDGAHNVEVRATDGAGNRSNSIQVGFTVDTIPPDISVTGIENGIYYGEPVSPVIEVMDLHEVEIEILLDGAPFGSGSTVDVEGEHILTVSATDAAGNIEREVVLFGIDMTEALIEIEGVSDQGSYNHSVIPVVTVVDDNVLSTSIALNGNPFVSGTEITTEGEYILAVTVTDIANNISIAEISFGIDLTPPDAPAVTSHEDGDSVPDEVIILAGSSEPNSVVTMTDDDGISYSSITDTDGNFSIANVPMSVGDNLFSLVAADRAGNISPTTQITIARANGTSTEITGYADRINSRVLVWLPSKDIDAHPHCNLFSHSGHKGHYHHYGHDEESMYEHIVSAFTEENIGYHIARTEWDFVRELRSQKYNSVLIARLNKSHHFHDRISGKTLLELRGMVASGTGLIVINTERSAIPALRDVIGAKISRPIFHSGDLVLEDSIATTGGTWSLSDTRGVKVKLRGGIAVGQIEYSCWKSNKLCSQPAVVLNQYGNGDVAFLPFNPAAIENDEQVKQLLLGLVEFAKPDSVDVLAGVPFEVQWLASPLSPPQDLVSIQELPDPLTVVEAFDGEILSDQLAQWSRHIETSDSIVLSSLVTAPEEGGSFTLKNDLYEGATGAGTLIGQGEFDLNIGQSVEGAAAELLSYVEAARDSAPHYKKGWYIFALQHIELAVQADSNSYWGSKSAIYHLQMAIYKLNLVGDIEGVTQTGRLLRVYQSRWINTLH